MHIYIEADHPTKQQFHMTSQPILSACIAHVNRHLIIEVTYYCCLFVFMLCEFVTHYELVITVACSVFLIGSKL